MERDKKKHWENVYKTKEAEQVSWTQELPIRSLDFINSIGLKKDARIIDIGGGDSKLADNLLVLGFENITVLDISAKALEKTKKRLGDKADKINWIVCDVTEFEPDSTFDVWHDRATFHFLTSRQQVSKYIKTVGKYVTGHLILGTFSDQGPKKCSGLDIQQYSETTLTAALKNDFIKMKCVTEDHITPFNTKQNFLFCSFKKKKD